MRGILSTLFLLMMSAASPFALQLPDKKIEITVGDHAAAAWYHSPVWIAIGILAIVVVVLLVALVARGGGTTVIKRLSRNLPCGLVSKATGRFGMPQRRIVTLVSIVVHAIAILRDRGRAAARRRSASHSPPPCSRSTMPTFVTVKDIDLPAPPRGGAVGIARDGCQPTPRRSPRRRESRKKPESNTSSSIRRQDAGEIERQRRWRRFARVRRPRASLRHRRQLRRRRPRGCISGMQAPRKIVDVDAAVSGSRARTARVEGVVILEAVDRRVRAASNRCGCCGRFRLLDQAAIDAVRQWKFTPTLLNGMPVPIVMTVTVNFKLGQ